MAPKLEQVFTLRAFFSKADTLPLGSTKGGTQRIVAPVTSGFLEGVGEASGIKLDIVPGGADWLRLDPSTGFAHADVRLQARNTETGESLYCYYPGIVKVDAATEKCMSGSPDAKSTESKDHYFFTTPVFEVSSERLKWMEQTVFLAHGHWHVADDGSQAAEYEVYKVISA